jgi:hypothetical protein
VTGTLTGGEKPHVTGSNFADPFLFEFNHENYLFAEEYPSVGGNGFISVFRIMGRKFEYLGQAIKENFHLSFPFIFRAGDNIYICPESSKNRNIQLYKSTSFPLLWEDPITLVDEIDAADPLILQGENGLWFLLCTVDRLNLGDHSSEMYIFYSENLENGIWSPHYQNPVQINPKYARNGGLLQIDGKMIRVAQEYGFLKYGEGYSLQEMQKLSENIYEEVEISKVRAADLNLGFDVIGTHHFSRLKELAATDVLYYS